MIFSSNSLIESEKERNLCTKFFAGYFFNEFTAGYARRIVHFNRYIQEVTGRDDLTLQAPQLSFDTHAYLCHERLRSKLADVLICDPARQTFLFIETKYLTNWTYAADVAKGVERLDKVFDAAKKPLWPTPNTTTSSSPPNAKKKPPAASSTPGHPHPRRIPPPKHQHLPTAPSQMRSQPRQHPPNPHQPTTSPACSTGKT